MKEYQLRQCTHLIQKLMKSPMTIDLRTPVNPVKDKVPNYPKIVKNPMDFGTIKSKLRKGKYPTTDDFYNDVKLVCDNARLFNGAESMLGFVADDIIKMVDTWRDGLCSCEEEQWFKDQQKYLKMLQDHIKEAPESLKNSPEIIAEVAEKAAKAGKK